MTCTYAIEVDAGQHVTTVSCKLIGQQAERVIKSGERFEMSSLFKDRLKLTIGVAIDFLEQERRYLARGIVLETSEKVRFEVSRLACEKRWRNPTA